MVLIREVDWGECAVLTTRVASKRWNSLSDEYEPLVNEDEISHDMVRGLPFLIQHPYRDPL